LRNGDWKKIPNNTLAEGDVIKLLPEDKAPALIGLITFEEEIN
jgi:magnesium-transporting ATPase (P-type)